MCEAAYLAIFTFEMTVKILAYGFMVGEDAYLNDAWCQLDFAVVTLAWLPILIPGFGNFSGAFLTAACTAPACEERTAHGGKQKMRFSSSPCLSLARATLQSSERSGRCGRCAL